MTTNQGISLRTFMPLVSDVSKEHYALLGDGATIGNEFVDLHVAALTPISEATKTDPSIGNMALVRLSCHGLNLYISTVELALSGRFDVALYLLRALFDCGPLVYAVAKSEELAKKFHAEDLTAADARKMQIADIGAVNPNLAAGLNAEWMDDYEAVNRAAHVKAVHAEKLLDVSDDRATPWVGGRKDEHECLRFVQAAHMGEFWHLSSLVNFRKELIGQAWLERFHGVKPRFSKWMKETKHEVEKETKS